MSRTRLQSKQFNGDGMITVTSDDVPSSVVANLISRRKAWITTKVPFKGRNVGHSYFIKILGNKFVVCDVNLKKNLYDVAEFNRYYKPRLISIFNLYKDEVPAAEMRFLDVIKPALHSKLKKYADERSNDPAGNCAYFVEGCLNNLNW